MRKKLEAPLGMAGHFWIWQRPWRWKWGTIYGYTDDTYTTANLRMTYRGPLVFFEI